MDGKYADYSGQSYVDMSNYSFMGELSSEEAAEKIAAAWNDEKPAGDHTEAEALSMEIFRIGLRMGLLAHGEDFLIEAGAPTKVIDEYRESKYTAISKEAARRLNLDDYRPLLMKNSRTKEQEKLIAEIATNGALKSLVIYHESNYSRVIVILMSSMAAEMHVDINSIVDPRDEGERDRASAISFLTRYFFAIHGDLRGPDVEYIDPAAKANLTESQEAEVDNLMKSVCKYQRKHDCGFFEAISPNFNLEGVDAAQIKEPITEITQKDFFGLPLSKVWRKEGIIARQGKAGQDINVGDKTIKGAVIVSASISDPDGKPLDIDGWCKSVQRGIGNLIDEAGGKKALPINVTPQQIYRAAARLPFTYSVSPEQVELVHEAMKILMYSPATLDCTAQFEKHTKIKQQSDIDYEEFTRKREAPALVMAYRDSFTLRGQVIDDGYKIMAYPLYYEYTHAINQIAWAPNKLLTGPEKPAAKEATAANTRGNPRTVAMKENILTRVYGMEQRKKAHKPYTALIRVDEVAEDCGIDLSTEKIRRTFRKNMSLYLEWLQQEGKITGYEETKVRREIVGYTVNL